LHAFTYANTSILRVKEVPDLNLSAGIEPQIKLSLYPLTSILADFSLVILLADAVYSELFLVLLPRNHQCIYQLSLLYRNMQRDVDVY
jgi:hypothetical protein